VSPKCSEWHPHHEAAPTDVTISSVTLDCADAANLAEFWAGALQRSVDPGSTEDFASIGLPDPQTERPHWMFIKVPEGKTAKNRMHPDLIAADFGPEVERLLALGAVRRAEFEEGGSRWVTLADPEGNEFDVVAPAD
jgi:hypothetical protein